MAHNSVEFLAVSSVSRGAFFLGHDLTVGCLPSWPRVHWVSSGQSADLGGLPFGFTQYRFTGLISFPEVYDKIASAIDCNGEPLDPASPRYQFSAMKEAYTKAWLILILNKLLIRLTSPGLQWNRPLI